MVFDVKYLTDAQCFAPDCGRTFWATTEQLRAMTRANRNRTYCPEHRSAHDPQR